jgi:hypothetical protein
MAFSYPSPSRRARTQTLLIFIVCILVVGTVAYYRVPSSQAGEISENALVVEAQPSSSPIEITDSDNDGTPDWQEQFSGSVKASNGISASGGASSAMSETDSTNEPKTLTDKFGRDFFTQYVNLKQTGLFDDPDTVTQSMQNLVENAVDSEQPVRYKLTDIRETSNSSDAALQTWIASVSKAFDSFTWTKNEVMLANESLTREDPSLLKKISPIISGYTKIIASLKATQTPESVSTEMIDLINAISTLKYAAQAMQSFGTDPLKGTIGVKAYSEGVQSLIAALEHIDAVVADRGITFEINSRVLETLVRY